MWHDIATFPKIFVRNFCSVAQIVLAWEGVSQRSQGFITLCKPKQEKMLWFKRVEKHFFRSDFIKHKNAKRHTFEMDVKIIFLHVKQQKTILYSPGNPARCFSVLALWVLDICRHPLYHVRTFICHISFQNTNTISKSQYSQPTFAPRSSPPSHHQFSCVTGSHWRNWKRRESACTCLIPVLVPLSTSVQLLQDSALKNEIKLARIQMLDPFSGTTVVKNGRQVSWRAG